MRRPISARSAVVVKVGSSALVAADGTVDDGAIDRVSGQVDTLWGMGHPTALVTSGAVAAGMPTLGLTTRPRDIPSLQVAAAVGQSQLMARYSAHFAERDRRVGQVLLTRDILARREQYLNAREALQRMLNLGVVPVINENDTVVVEELRFGDNDRLAAMVSHLIRAGMLILLTDTPGIYMEDPGTPNSHRLIDAVRHTDEVFDQIKTASSAGLLGSGGVATKIAAAQMAAWSGIPTVIASATEPDVAARAVTGDRVGTWIEPRARTLSARKLWIAFGLPAEGRLRIDTGAAEALSRGSSLLAAGVAEVEGDFADDAAVELIHDGGLLAKGIVAMTSEQIRAGRGQHSFALGGEVIHRDNLVLLT